MKLKQVIEIQKVLGKTIPVDMAEDWVYYSKSREEFIDILELDIVHAIRILRKHVGTKTEMYDTKTNKVADVNKIVSNMARQMRKQDQE